MRRIVGFCGALSLLLVACSGEDGGGVYLDDASNGRTVVIRIGQDLAVTLRSLTDGGYSRWSLATPPDPALLEPTGSRHLPGSGTPGDGGKDVFTFRGVSAGQTSLVATATRAFSGETETYELTVVVGTAPSTVSGVVVGSAGLPVEGAEVVVSGHPAATTGADGRFVVEGVEPGYDVMVGVSQPEFGRAFAAAWLGLHRRDPVLAVARSWPQAGARRASVCGATSGDVTFPATAPWVLVEPSSPFGELPTASHLDPASGTYCASGGWTGPAERAGSVHVLAVESAAGVGGDFVATGFPAAGSLNGLTLSDGATDVIGQDLPLAPAQSVALPVMATGPGAPGANLFVAAYWDDRWPGAGVPLADLRSGSPWPEVALPLLPDVRVRLTAWSNTPVGASWRERSIAPLPSTLALWLVAPPVLSTPEPGAVPAVGTTFRWTPAEQGAAFSVRLLADASTSTPATELIVHGASPELPLPDFSIVGVALPRDASGSWEARAVGPAADADALVAGDHLGLAFQHGLGEEEWFTGVSPPRSLTFAP